MALDTDTKVVRTTLSCLSAAGDAAVRYVFHQGGSSSGKTFGILIALYCYCATTQPPPNPVVTVAGITVPHLKGGAMRDWETIARERPDIRLVNRTDRAWDVNGWRVEFTALDRPGKARGPRRELLYVNEANLHDRATIEQLEMRTAGAIVMDWNPTARFWAHDLFETTDQTARAYRTTYRDNPHVPAAVVAKLEGYRETDPRTWRIYGEGRTGVVEGLVYPEFAVGAFPDPAERDWGARGLDFGYTHDPTAGVEVAARGRDLHVRQWCYEPTPTAPGLIGIAHAREVDGPLWCDRDEVLVNALREAGFDARKVAKPPGSIEAGIALVRGYRLVIDPASRDLVRELTAYTRREVGGVYREPVDRHNHALDALRYAVMGHHEAPRPNAHRPGRLYALA